MTTRMIVIQIKATIMPRFEKAKKEEQRTKGREGDLHRTKSQSDRNIQNQQPTNQPSALTAPEQVG